jgi:hypothetical protein
MSTKSTELVQKLQELSKAGRVWPPTIPRTGQDITADQLPVFGELLVILAEDLDKAQRKIERLTVALIWMTGALVIMTLVLVVDVVHRIWTGH